MENENSMTDKELELKKCYVIQMNSGAYILGMLISKGECLTGEGAKKYYRFAFDNYKYVDLYEDEISEIQMMQSSEDRKEFFTNFELAHGVECLDDEDNVLSSRDILGSAIFKKGVWDNLHEGEKRELVFMLQLSPDEIVEFLNILLDYKNENEKLYEKREDVMNAVLDFVNNIDEIKDIPLFSGMAEYLYRKSRIETLISTVTK